MECVRAKNWEKGANTLGKLVAKLSSFEKDKSPESTTRGWWRALFSGCGVPVRKPVWSLPFQNGRKTGEQSHPHFSHTENPTQIRENNLTHQSVPRKMPTKLGRTISPTNLASEEKKTSSAEQSHARTAPKTPTHHPDPTPPGPTPLRYQKLTSTRWRFAV